MASGVALGTSNSSRRNNGSSSRTVAIPAAKPIFFSTAEQFRTWLDRNHATTSELWVGFYRKASGRPSITWPESVDEALCVGWIDGIRKSVDASSYMIRFTARKPTSTWSEVNIGRVADLKRQGRMRPSGAAAFENRIEAKSGIYAYEQRETAALDPEAERQFRAHPKAWKYFQARPAWYRKTAIWRVVSAKRPETQQKRLDLLIANSEAGQPIPELRRT